MRTSLRPRIPTSNLTQRGRASRAGQVLPLRPTREIAFETDEGTWVSVDASPDGNHIAFDLLGDLYTLDVQGGRATPITRGMAFDTQPTYSRDGEWIAFISDRSGAENVWVVRAGGVVGIGAHGEMPGPGFHWELEAHVQGGMTPFEALRAGTMGSALAIGRATELGSIEPGKLADLVVLSADPRTDIRNSTAISLVMMNGRLYDTNTLDEIWPRRKPLDAPWFVDDRPPVR